MGPTRCKMIAVALVAVALLLVVVFPSASRAEWVRVFDEHFQPPGDYDNPLVAPPWPWWLPGFINQVRWHWNPNPPVSPYHRLSEAQYSNSSWGLQDWAYNTNVTRFEEERQRFSLWCARTNQNQPDRPFYPDQNNYLNNQNAWLAVGPFDLRRAVAARVSFWYYMLLDHFAFDSLTVGAFTDPNVWTSTGNYFRQNAPYGVIIKTGNNDWLIRSFALDSLRLAAYPDSMVSMLGRRGVYIFFAWQTNGSDIAGRGCFIDDISFVYDDGLFNIYPQPHQARVQEMFGYPVTEDSIFWTDQNPATDDEVLLKLEWRITGSQGEVPPFYVNCYIDDELFYSQRYEITVDPNDTTTTYHTTVTDELWTVTWGEHTIVWRLDAENAVEESNENDNLYETSVLNEWNPAPELVFHSPAAVDTVSADGSYTVYFSVTDSVEAWVRFFAYWTYDTSGLAANPDIIMGYNPIYWNYTQPTGDRSFLFNVADAVRRGGLLTDTLVYVCGFASDNAPRNFTWAVAPGRLYIEPPAAVRSADATSPRDFGLARAYPNPFNRTVNLEYHLAGAGPVRLAVYDLAGKQVALLASGTQSAGVYHTVWVPKGLPAGVYMVRLEAGGRTYLAKAVYMP